MFHHLLVATDFSEASARAIDLAAGLARALRARVTVLHVYETGEVSSPRMAELAERTWPRASRARAQLARSVDRLRAAGADAEGLLRFGLLPAAIVAAAREVGADLVVTGTRGRTGLTRLLHGSIAEEILRESRIPVVVAGLAPEREDAPRERERDNVVPLRAR